MKKSLVLVLALMVAFVSCGKKQQKNVVDQTLNGKTIFPIEILGERYCPKSTATPAEFKFDENKINGCTGCNSYFADYKCDNGTIKFSNGGMTMMMCDEKSMTVESNLKSVFEKATRYEITELKCCKKECCKKNKCCKKACPAEEQKCCKKAENGEKSCPAEAQKCCKNGEKKCCKKGEKRYVLTLYNGDEKLAAFGIK